MSTNLEDLTVEERLVLLEERKIKVEDLPVAALQKKLAPLAAPLEGTDLSGVNDFVRLPTAAQRPRGLFGRYSYTHPVTVAAGTEVTVNVPVSVPKDFWRGGVNGAFVGNLLDAGPGWSAQFGWRLGSMPADALGGLSQAQFVFNNHGPAAAQFTFVFYIIA